MASTFFSGNIEASRSFLDEHGYIPKAISKSRFNRRLHAIKSDLWKTLFDLLAEASASKTTLIKATWWTPCQWPCATTSASTAVGSTLPKKAPERSEATSRASGATSTACGGASCGERGRQKPVEFALEAGSEADVAVFKDLELELPEGSIIFADKGYTDYDYEDLLEEVGLHLKAQRRKNSKRPMPAWEEFLGKPIRRYIETIFSRLRSLFPKKIHAVTPRGFELKIVCFLLAFSIQCL